MSLRPARRARGRHLSGSRGGQEPRRDAAVSGWWRAYCRKLTNRSPLTPRLLPRRSGDTEYRDAYFEGLRDNGAFPRLLGELIQKQQQAGPARDALRKAMASRNGATSTSRSRHSRAASQPASTSAIPWLRTSAMRSMCARSRPRARAAGSWGSCSTLACSPAASPTRTACTARCGRSTSRRPTRCSRRSMRPPSRAPAAP